MSDTSTAPISFKTIVPNVPPADDGTRNTTLLEVQQLSLFYGQAQALKNVSITLRERMVTALIGPSGCGKSTLLRCFNRLNDLIHGVRLEGRVLIGGTDIYARTVDCIELRKRVG